MANDRKLVLEILGVDKTKQAFDSVKKNTDKTKKSFVNLKNVLVTIGTSLVIKEFLELTNTYQSLQNRLKLVTSGTEELKGVQEELFQISQRTRGGFAETVELYQKLALQSKNLGLQSSELTQITENVNKVIGIAGVNSVQASAGILQLSQAFASGRLQGDEFRSISENIPPLLDIFAKELGVTRGELKKLGSEGKITSEIIATALLKETENINEAFSKLSPTIGQATTTIANSFLNLAGQFAETTGIADALASALISVSNGIDKITDMLEPFEDTFENVRERIKNTTNELNDLEVGLLDVQNTGGLLFRQGGVADIATDEATALKIKQNREELQRLQDVLLDLERQRIERDTAIGVITDDETSDKINKNKEALEEFVKVNQNSAFGFSAGQKGALEFNRENDKTAEKLQIISNQASAFGNAYIDAINKGTKELDIVSENKFPRFVQVLKDAGDTTMQLDGLFTNTFNNFSNALADSLMTGKFAFKDFAKSVIADIAMIIAKQQAMLAIQKALGFFGVTSIGGVDTKDIFTPRANGGSVTAGQPYMVGERGAELFVPRQSGTIVPNNKLSNAGATNINFTINTVDARGIDELLTSRRNTIVNVINDALNRQGKEALV